MADIEIVGDMGELEIVEPPEKVIPTQDPQRRVQPLKVISPHDLQVFIREQILREIVIHAKSNMGMELGGVLIGEHYRWKGQYWVLVDGYIKAEGYVNTAASFKFTHDSWSQISREREKRFNDRPMVGWHHTHPGYGVFLSHMDTFIQRNFFNLPYQVALVVDPRREEFGFFIWKGHKIEGVGCWYIHE